MKKGVIAWVNIIENDEKKLLSIKSISELRSKTVEGIMWYKWPTSEEFAEVEQLMIPGMRQCFTAQLDSAMVASKRIAIAPEFEMRVT